MSKQIRSPDQASVDGSTKRPDAMPQPPTSTPKTIHFWGTFAALSILAFISALDVSIISTALPRITTEIGGGRTNTYVWIANSFVISSSTIQPLSGQLANILGRRIPLVGSIALFVIGSGVAGGAINTSMLIAGRSVQGVGAGGIYVLIDIVCCDMVPQRERGKYLGLMFSGAGIAAGLGPVVGGALAEANWRWVFYINIPICGLALLLIAIFMIVRPIPRPNSDDSDHTPKILRVDYPGNLIFIPSVIAVLYGLVTGGIDNPWSSWRVIVPLVLGIVGWISFHIQQTYAKYPSVPNRLFSNRTSAIAYTLTFVSSVTVQGTLYFLPVYFQSRGATVIRSGINILPYAIGSLFFAIVGGALLSQFGKYVPLHVAAFTISAISYGLFTLLDSTSSTAMWATLQLINSISAGFFLSVLLPAILVALPESDVASASAAYSFIRSFGYIWGVTIPSIIFNAVIIHYSERVSSVALRDRLRNGAAYAFVSEAHTLQHDPANNWSQVADVYSQSLRAIWWLCLGISLFGLILVFGQRQLELKKELDTEFGLDGPYTKESEHVSSRSENNNNVRVEREKDV